MTNPTPIDNFIEHLLQEKFGNSLSQQKYQQKKEEMTQHFYENLNRKAVEALSQDARIEFKQLLDKHPSQDQLLSYMETHLPNLKIFLAGFIMDFRVEQLGDSHF